MINDKNLKQESGNDATNFQANAIVVNQGISYQDAKNIALDVFDNNYIRLSEIASQKAKLRAEELIEEFLETVKSKAEIELVNIQNPSFQISLFNAQKEYANRGNEELKKYLTQLLIKLLQFKEDTYESVSTPKFRQWLIEDIHFY